jgi:hypothetical protein
MCLTGLSSGESGSGKLQLEGGEGRELQPELEFSPLWSSLPQPHGHTVMREPAGLNLLAALNGKKIDH